MTALRLFVPKPWPAVGSTLTLDAMAANHVKVLRLAAGSEVELFDGETGSAIAKLQRVERRETTVVIHSVARRDDYGPAHITVLHALPAMDRMDVVVQKCTELGVAAFIPVCAERAAPSPEGERAARKLEHWRSVAMEASRQCGRVSIPQVHPPQDLQAVCALTPTTAVRLFLHTDGPRLSLDAALRAAPPSCDVYLLIGPEGGWSSREADLALASGFEAVTLGPRVLRTETAAIVACAGIQILCGDLKETS